MSKKIKFAASYSGGKDGMLALYRAIESGYEPVSLLTTYNESANRSWFHGVPVEVLNKVSQLIDIPLELVKTGAGDDYAKDFEKALLKLKDSAAKIESIFPLWNESRRDLVYEFIESGFKAVITIVDSSRLSEKFLGKTLTEELIKEIVAEGADICGENGEYHTFVYDGPLFKEPVNFKFDEIIRNGNYSVLPLSLE